MKKIFYLKDVYSIALYYSFIVAIVGNFIPNFTKYWMAIGYVLIFLIALVLIKMKSINFKLSELNILCLFLFCQLIAYMRSSEVGIANNRYEQLIIFILSYIIFVIVLSKTKFVQKDIDKYYKFIIKIVLISCIYAIIFQFRADVFSFKNNGNFIVSNVYKSFWGHRNHFGIILVTGIIACFNFYIRGEQKTKMVFFVAFFAGNLILTFSRTSYLTLAIFFSTFYILNIKKYRKIVIPIIFIIITFFIIYIKIEPVNQFVNTFMIRESSGLSGRDGLWEIARSLINGDTILFGRGLGYARFALAEDTIGKGTGFHNLYLDYMVSGGICFFIGIFYIIYSIIIKSLRIFKVNSSYGKFLISAIIAFLVYPYFENTGFFKIHDMPSMLMTYMVIVFPIMSYNSYFLKKCDADLKSVKGVKVI